MSTSESLTQFQQAYLQAYPPDAPQQFTVYTIEPDMSRQSVPYNRRDFYQISLYTSGTTQLDHAGVSQRVEGPALLLYNPLSPYACAAQTPLTGFFCLFTPDFLQGPGYATSLLESPLFQPGANPVQGLTAAQNDLLSLLFGQMLTEARSPYRYKYDLLRNYVLLVLHEALRLQPGLPPPAMPTSPGRLAAQFRQLLEQQFPIASPSRPLQLHHAEAFAGQLGVHVNYLNRVLREATGRSTSAHLAARVAQEAKALLRHTDWSVADIADSLSFADPTYFAHFFRKHSGTSPKAFRQQAAAPTVE